MFVFHCCFLSSHPLQFSAEGLRLDGANIQQILIPNKLNLFFLIIFFAVCLHRIKNINNDNNRQSILPYWKEIEPMAS